MTTSMFTDGEFEEIRKAVRPDILEDKSAIRRKIAELDASRFELEGKIPNMNIASAIHILLQGRNFFARYLGEPEIPIPATIEKILNPKELEKKMNEKHVALFVHKSLVASVVKTYSLAKDLCYETYTNMRSLLEAIAAGKVCGVVSVQPKLSSVENNIRHDLKYLPGWADRASTVALPPCFDVDILRFMEGVEIIQQMEAGEYKKPENSIFSLKDSIPFLATKMKTPKSPIKVWLVDDDPRAIEGMASILEVWPMIKMNVFIQKRNEEDIILPIGDIFLLDENMGRVSGSMIAASLKERDPSTIIGSTTSGLLLEQTFGLHFGEKELVKVSQRSAMWFVEFVNKLINAFENNSGT